MLPMRVMVLEDQISHRTIIVNMLRQLGCTEIIQATDAKEGLKLLRRFGPADVALCMLRLGGVDSLSFLQQAGRSHLIRAIIINTCLSKDLQHAVGRLASMLGMEFIGEFSKPYTLSALYKLIEKVPKKTITTIAPPRRKLASVKDERRGINLREFKAYFQPKFNLLTGEVNSVEVLARWHHPIKGLLTPAVFMPVLENTSLIDELLFEQLEQGLILQRKAKNEGHILNLSLNIDSSQLDNTNLAKKIKAVLDKHQLPGTGLTFELTESGLIKSLSTSLETLIRIRMLGSSLSIDDFGAGHASLQRLCLVPFTEIKLDSCFVQNLMHEPRYRAVVSNALQLANRLGMQLIVEGIETEEQRQELLKLGCMHGQGYLCARPMSGTDLVQWLKTSYQTWLVPDTNRQINN